MSKANFRFEPDLWLHNRNLRACSPAARGLWIDLLAIMHPGGYLVLATGLPMSDAQVAAVVGSPVRQVSGWIRELGDAGIFSVSEDGRLYSSRMVKEAAFAARAKKDGEKGQAKKKLTARTVRPLDYDQQPVMDGPITVRHPIGSPLELGLVPTIKPAPTAPIKPAKRALDWWLSPAGWVRKGSEQAMSMLPNESLQDFQIRVAVRLPMGRHLDVLTAGQVRAVEAQMPKDVKAPT
jgi:hypothetical protein